VYNQLIIIKRLAELLKSLQLITHFTAEMVKSRQSF